MQDGNERDEREQRRRAAQERLRSALRHLATAEMMLARHAHQAASQEFGAESGSPAVPGSTDEGEGR